MLWPKKNSYKEFANEKKFLRLDNSPPPPHNFSNGPSLKTPAWEATCLRTKLKASMSRIKDNFPRLTHKSGRIGI